jgi:type IV pilus assembly protein PilW
MTRGRGNQGFTITELMVAITIFAVVMAAIYSAYLSQQKAFQITEATTEAQQNLRAAMYVLEREIRMAGYDPVGSKHFGFSGPLQAASSSITFSYDANEDGLAGATEYVHFEHAGKVLRRCLQNAGPCPETISDIAENISGVSFQCFDSNGISTITPGSVKTVLVTVVASKDNHIKELSTQIQCRNMGL